MKRLAAAPAALCLLAVPVPAIPAPVNLVVNGEFTEILFPTTARIPAHWEVSPELGWYVNFGRGYGDVLMHFASNGCLYGDGCTMSQTLPTLAGAHYDLAFLFNPGREAGADCGGGVCGDTQVYWGTQLAIDLAGGPHEWQSVVLTGLPATGPTVLTFLGYQELSDNLLTAVTVTPTPAPLPGAGDLFAGGVALLAALGRRRRTGA